MIIGNLRSIVVIRRCAPDLDFETRATQVLIADYSIKGRNTEICIKFEAFIGSYLTNSDLQTVESCGIIGLNLGHWRQTKPR